MGVNPWVACLTWSRKAEGTIAWQESAGGREGAEILAAQDPRDTAKAALLEVQFRVCLLADVPLEHLRTVPTRCPASHPSAGHLPPVGTGASEATPRDERTAYLALPAGTVYQTSPGHTYRATESRDGLKGATLKATESP